MLNLAKSLSLFTFFVLSSFAESAEWNYKKSSFDATGAVSLKTSNGSVLSLDNSNQSGLRSSASPTVLSVQQGANSLFAIKVWNSWYSYLDEVGLLLSSPQSISADNPQWVMLGSLAGSSSANIRRDCTVRSPGDVGVCVDMVSDSAAFSVVSGAVTYPASCSHLSCTATKTSNVVSMSIGSATLKFNMSHEFMVTSSCSSDNKECYAELFQRISVGSQQGVEIVTGGRWHNFMARRSSNNAVHNRYTISRASGVIAGRSVHFISVSSPYQLDIGSYTPTYDPIVNVMVVETPSGFTVTPLPTSSIGVPDLSYMATP